MIVISQSLVLAQRGLEGANNPVIGWEQLATIANTVADSETVNNPVRNVCNPATNLKWVSGSTATQYITITTSRVDPVDYVALAEHNLGSTSCLVSVEGYAELDDLDAPIWEELIGPVALVNDQPLVLRFEPRSLIGVRVKLVPDGVAPSIAVLHVGKLLVLPREIYGGHTPITLGKRTQVSSGRTSRGKYLGRITLQQSVSTSASLEHLPKGWYRTRFAPFAEYANADGTFFFAWRPQEFPAEVGYCWTTSDIVPTNSQPEGFMTVDIAMSGIVS